jgi:hypothetical protein
LQCLVRCNKRAVGLRHIIITKEDFFVDSAALYTKHMTLASKYRLQLLYQILRPSWLSSAIAITVGLVIFIGPFLLFRFGTTAQEGILGLSLAYQHSSLTTVSHAIGTHFLGNSVVGQSVFVAFWGAVGLVVYYLTLGLVRQGKDIFSLIRQFGYVNVIHHQFIQYHLSRSFLRIGAVVAWCLLLPLLIYRLIPYGVAAAHASAFRATSINNWLLNLLFCIICILAVHALTVCLRLMVLRTRLFGASPEVYED